MSDLPVGSLAVRPATAADTAVIAGIDIRTWSGAVSPGSPPGADGTPAHVPGPGPVGTWVATRAAGSGPGARTDGQGAHRAPVGDAGPGAADRVVGYVQVGAAAPTLPSHRHVWSVTGLAVDPDEQGRGVGTALLAAAAAGARDAGATKLTLRVLGGNLRAQQVYRRAGFVVEGVLSAEFVIGGAAVDDVLMALTLHPPTGGRRRRTAAPLPRWVTRRQACVLVLRGATARVSAPVALVVGSVLTAVNQGAGLAAGRHSGALTARVVANYAIPYAVSSYGALRGLRATPAAAARRAGQ